AGVPAGTAFGLVVAAADGRGNVDTSFNGPVALTNNSSYLGAISGTLTVTAVNGVASFSGLSATKAGSYSLSAAAPGTTLVPVTTSSVQVTALPATHLRAADPRGSSLFGEVLAGGTMQVSVYAEDGYGNADAAYAGSIT